MINNNNNCNNNNNNNKKVIKIRIAILVRIKND